MPNVRADGTYDPLDRVPIGLGGTGADTAPEARTSLGVPWGRSALDCTDASHSGDADVTLADDAADCRLIDLTGTAAAAFQVLVPHVEGRAWLVRNGTGQTATVIGATGTGADVPTGSSVWVYCDGTDITRTSSALSGANSDITALAGLTTPIGLGDGGTGVDNAPDARTALGVQWGLAQVSCEDATTVGEADVTLSAGNAGAAILDLTGSADAAFKLIVPLTNIASWLVRNGSGQTVTVVGATGTGIEVATSKVARVFCDGTNIVRETADL